MTELTSFLNFPVAVNSTEFASFLDKKDCIEGCSQEEYHRLDGTECPVSI